MLLLLGLSVVVGWLVGGLANWAADVLPHWHDPTAPVHSRPRHWQHWWTLPGVVWRWSRSCAACDTLVGRRAPVLEAAMITVFAYSAWLLGERPLTLVVVWLYVAYLLTVLVIDLEQRRVLNLMALPMAGLALAFSLAPGMPGPVAALVGSAAGFGFFALLYVVGRGKLGMGDVKLAGVIGLMVGWPAVVQALVVGVLLGGVAALALLLSRRAGRKSTMAYAPYLALGALFTLWGQMQ
jgi:leader peptidase (prepilin peptidase) / N-methyltransferase